MANPNWKLLLVRALLIVAAGFWVFAPVLHGDWLMDDDLYITHNALLGDPARLWKIWFAPGTQIEYYPVEASLQLLEWHLWHGDTLGYHFTNLTLHLIGALLVWRLLAKLGLRLAWLGGLLFAIHPVVVESVAWIAEFKNVLSLPPLLLAMCAWIDFDARHRNRDYALALSLFLLAMLCKISMAFFPLIILLYAWWKRGRIGRRDLVNVAPFLAISILLGLTTILVGDRFRTAHLQPPEIPPIGGLFSHLALAGLSIAFYFSKCVWPIGLLPIYPKWIVNPPHLVQFLPWPILLAAFVWFWRKRAGWGRHALLGVGFFLINLAPFLGFNSVTYMGFSWVMDHLVYLPLVGLIGLAIAALGEIDKRITGTTRPIFAGFVALIMGLLAWNAHAYAGIFIGQGTLWAYTIKYNPQAWLAHNNLGNVLFERGHVPEAIEQYRLALQANPDTVEAHNNLGVAYNLQGHTAEAIAQFEAALVVNPHFAMGHVNLANLFSQIGRVPEAISHYQEALEIDPGYTEARTNLARLQPPKAASLQKGNPE